MPLILGTPPAIVHPEAADGDEMRLLRLGLPRAVRRAILSEARRTVFDGSRLAAPVMTIGSGRSLLRPRDAPTLRFVQSTVSNGSVQTTWTFSNAYLGPRPNPVDTRYLIVGAYGTAGVNRAVSSLTILGVSATSVVASGPSSSPVALFILQDNLFDFGTIVLTVSGNVSSAGICVYNLINPVSGTAFQTSTSTSFSATHKGFAVSVQGNRGVGSTAFSGVFEDFDTDTDPANDRNFSGGHALVADGTTIANSSTMATALWF